PPATNCQLAEYAQGSVDDGQQLGFATLPATAPRDILQSAARRAWRSAATTDRCRGSWGADDARDTVLVRRSRRQERSRPRFRRRANRRYSANLDVLHLR